MSPAKQLLTKLRELSTCEEDDSLLINKVWICVEVLRPSLIKLNSIISEQPGRGYGNQIMSSLINYADIFKVDIELQAEPFGHRTLTRMQLITWYRKFGFFCDNNKDNFALTRLYK